MKLCLACSAGGHLTELKQLESLYRKYNHFFVTFRREDTLGLSKYEKVYFVSDPKRSLFKILKNVLQSLLILAEEKPDVVITTGAGVAVPLCYLSKIFRARIVYMESFCRIKKPSLTGRVLYPIADIFLVQWKEMLKNYGKKAKYYGGVF